MGGGSLLLPRNPTLALVVVLDLSGLRLRPVYALCPGRRDFVLGMTHLETSQFILIIIIVIFNWSRQVAQPHTRYYTTYNSLHATQGSNDTTQTVPQDSNNNQV